MCEINFLCVHKGYREFKMAALLISEVTRRVNLRDKWQAVCFSLPRSTLPARLSPHLSHAPPIITDHLTPRSSSKSNSQPFSKDRPSRWSRNSTLFLRNWRCLNSGPWTKTISSEWQSSSTKASGTWRFMQQICSEISLYWWVSKALLLAKGKDRLHIRDKQDRSGEWKEEGTHHWLSLLLLTALPCHEQP